jgi:hypothetical protein
MVSLLCERIMFLQILLVRPKTICCGSCNPTVCKFWKSDLYLMKFFSQKMYLHFYRNHRNHNIFFAVTVTVVVNLTFIDRFLYLAIFDFCPFYIDLHMLHLSTNQKTIFLEFVLFLNFFVMNMIWKHFRNFFAFTYEKDFLNLLKIIVLVQFYL